MAEFHVFYKKSALPPLAEINRAMCSRGFVIELQGDAAPHERTDLALQVDGKPVPASVSAVDASSPTWAELRAAALDSEQGAARLSVLKNCDVRVTLRTDDADGAKWVRDVARNMGLLSCGAYENPSASKFINYGR